MKSVVVGTAGHIDHGKSALVRALTGTDPDRLKEHLCNHVAGVFHPAGTCRMGANGDPLAVVDPEGKVYGVGGLRVADASIMPNVVAGNTNIPTIMLAEKIAATMMESNQAGTSKLLPPSWGAGMGANRMHRLGPSPPP